MNLIQITQTKINGAEVNSVNARELHKVLEVGKDFSNWIKDRIEKYDFVDGADFVRVTENNLAKSGEVKKTLNLQGKKVEYIITLNMAKELSMVENNDKGRQARRYFIEAEEKLRANKPKLPQNYKEALIELVAKVDEIEMLENKIKADQPLVSFAKSIEASVDSVLIGTYAKLLSDSENVTIGQNRLFDWLRDNGYLITGGARHNVPYQKYIDNGYFEVESKPFIGPKGLHQAFTPKITGKGQISLALKIVNAFKNVA